MPNNSKEDTRLAVLIDADNVSAHFVKALMEEVARYGIPTIKRIYGDWTKPQLNGWKPYLLDYAISPVQQFGYTTGKNATDSALIIDAMDLLYSERVDGFCLVSSDSDFTRLATRLREAGKLVYGIGEQKTPNAFIAACDRFIFLEILQEEGKQEAKETGSQKTKSNGRKAVRKLDAELRKLVSSSIEAVMDEDGWAFLGDVGNMIIKKQPSFDPRNYGYSKLSSLLRSLDTVELEQRPTNIPNIYQLYIRWFSGGNSKK